MTNEQLIKRFYSYKIMLRVDPDDFRIKDEFFKLYDEMKKRGL